MIRQTITPTVNQFTLTIPDDWVGEKITVIYDKEWIETEKLDAPEKNFRPSDLFKDCQVDLSNFKFNRDEANDYE